MSHFYIWLFQGATGGTACPDSTAKDLACKILKMHKDGKLRLKDIHDNDLGNANGGDGATAYDNIVDTCNGCVAKR